MSFSAALLALNPIFHLRLGEDSGITAADEKNEVAATYTGTYTLGVDSLVPADPFNTAFRTEGDGYVEITHETALNITNQITMIAIVKFTADQSDVGLVAKWRNIDSTTNAYALTVTNSNALGIIIHVTGETLKPGLWTANAYNDGEPHLLIGRRNGSDMKVVVANTDGSTEVVTRNLQAGNIDNSSNNIRIGNWSNATTGGFDGDIDEVALFGTDLSDADIDELILAWHGILPGTPTEGAAGRLWSLAAYDTILQGRAGRLWTIDAASILLQGAAGRLWSLDAHELVEAAAGRLWSLDVSVLTQGDADRLWTLLAEPITSPTVTSVTYTCILEGATDSLPDLILPISSFQGALRSGRPSFLSVVVPSALKFTDAIIARPNGALVIIRNVIYTDGATQSIEIARVNPPTIRTDRGARAASITLSGEKQTTNTTPNSVTVDGVSYRSLQANGKRRFRGRLNNNLRAGDTAVIDDTGESIIVETVQYTVGPTQATMEIAEL